MSKAKFDILYKLKQDVLAFLNFVDEGDLIFSMSQNFEPIVKSITNTDSEIYAKLLGFKDKDFIDDNSVNEYIDAHTNYVDFNMNTVLSNLVALYITQYMIEKEDIDIQENQILVYELYKYVRNVLKRQDFKNMTALDVLNAEVGDLDYLADKISRHLEGEEFPILANLLATTSEVLTVVTHCFATSEFSDADVKSAASTASKIVSRYILKEEIDGNYDMLSIKNETSSDNQSITYNCANQELRYSFSTELFKSIRSAFGHDGSVSLYSLQCDRYSNVDLNMLRPVNVTTVLVPTSKYKQYSIRDTYEELLTELLTSDTVRDDLVQLLQKPMFLRDVFRVVTASPNSQVVIGSKIVSYASIVTAIDTHIKTKYSMSEKVRDALELILYKYFLNIGMIAVDYEVISIRSRGEITSETGINNVILRGMIYQCVEKHKNRSTFIDKDKTNLHEMVHDFMIAHDALIFDLLKLNQFTADLNSFLARAQAFLFNQSEIKFGKDAQILFGSSDFINLLSNLSIYNMAINTNSSAVSSPVLWQAEDARLLNAINSLIKNEYLKNIGVNEFNKSFKVKVFTFEGERKVVYIEQKEIDRNQPRFYRRISDGYLSRYTYDRRIEGIEPAKLALANAHFDEVLFNYINQHLKTTTAPFIMTSGVSETDLELLAITNSRSHIDTVSGHLVFFVENNDLSLLNKMMIRTTTDFGYTTDQFMALYLGLTDRNQTNFIHDQPDITSFDPTKRYVGEKQLLTEFEEKQFASSVRIENQTLNSSTNINLKKILLTSSVKGSFFYTKVHNEERSVSFLKSLMNLADIIKETPGYTRFVYDLLLSIKPIIDGNTTLYNIVYNNIWSENVGNTVDVSLFEGIEFKEMSKLLALLLLFDQFYDLDASPIKHMFEDDKILTSVILEAK